MIEIPDRVRKPALLVVDMQNDFVRVGAALEVADALNAASDSLNNLNKQLAIHDMELFYQSEHVRLENEKLQSEVENNRLNLLLRLIIIFFLILFLT